MAFIPVPDCVGVQIEGSIDGQTTINDLYFRSTIGPRTASDVIDLADSIVSWGLSQYAPLLNVGWSGRVVRARGLTNALGFVAQRSLAAAAGEEDSEALPNNCSMCVSFSTGLAGRSNHGRNYVPALSDGQVTGNMIDPTWANNVVAAYGSLLFPGDVLPDGWIWVVVSRFTAGAPRVTGTFQEIISVQVNDLVVDSMRTRLPGRGR